MTATVGNAGLIKVADSSGVLQTVAELKSYSIDTSSDTIETSKMGTAQRSYVKGISSFSGSADVFWDATHWTTNKFNPTEGSVGASNKVVALEVYPTGTGSKWTGNIVITGYNTKASFDGIIEATISFQGTGAITFA